MTEGEPCGNDRKEALREGLSSPIPTAYPRRLILPPAPAACPCRLPPPVVIGGASDISHRGTVWRDAGRDAGSDVSVA